jgi:hypothetical protein
MFNKQLGANGTGEQYVYEKLILKNIMNNLISTI